MRQAANTHHARPCSFSRVPLAPPVIPQVAANAHYARPCSVVPLALPLPIEENLRCELHHLIRRARHWQSQWHGESKGWYEAESQSHAQYTGKASGTRRRARTGMRWNCNGSRRNHIMSNGSTSTVQITSCGASSSSTAARTAPRRASPSAASSCTTNRK